ncbi:MAG TPA: hypothetical protein VN915_14520 [Elusimicrobiota bacterium]|nr:hypothetical protein [Elusimicrobiota bacterium]
MTRLRRGLLAAAGAIFALFAGDLIVARLRGDAAFGTVRVDVLYAVPEKAARMDYSTGAPEDVECVRALFPHFGDAPCWYASRQKTKRVDL